MLSLHNYYFCQVISIRFIFLLLIVFSSMIVRAQRTTSLPPFRAEEQPAAPDYRQLENWAAWPFREDAADFFPKTEEVVPDSAKTVDVFYIYPTLYEKGERWCASTADEKLNRRIDRLPVRYQASVFNRVGRVYVPRYRQAIIESFYDEENGPQALQFAYEDVKRAFLFYWKERNSGRPLILASHSQGSYHLRQLLREFFDEPEYRNRLICAYVVGYGVFPETYRSIKPCMYPEDVHCYVTWSSFQEGYIPDSASKLIGKICTNPISWTMDSSRCEARTGILLNLNKREGFKNRATIRKNYLWVKTRAPFISGWKTLHLVDYNLFWKSIRQNAGDRVKAWEKRYSLSGSEQLRGTD
jgi:hypothetical protein